MADENQLPIPAKLTKFSDNQKISNYFNQLHDKIEEFERRLEALENP